ncbi:MAG: hypothetical protein ACQEXJ_06545 [Myxococcota bacterium]
MKHVAARLLHAALSLGLVASIAGPARAASPLSPSETARVLAGMSVPEASLDAVGRDRLGGFLERIATHWENFERRLGTPMRDWARDRLAYEEGDLVFYPFSGPDFATIHRFYPEADRYVMVAKQDAGRVPDLTAPEAPLRDMMQVFDAATKHYGRSGFFKTRKLYERFDSHTAPIEGLTIVIAVMAEREGFDVTDVQPIRIGDDARIEPHPGAPDDVGTWSSVRLKLERRADDQQVLVDYVNLDLSDENLETDEAGRKWLERVSHARVVFKAASHLPQWRTFDVVAGIVRDRALSIVQDETGLEYSELTERFDTRLFGKLVRISEGFNPDYQPDMRRAYRKRDDIGPLPFRYGYWKDGDFALVIAEPKG